LKANMCRYSMCRHVFMFDLDRKGFAELQASAQNTWLF
jgi:hypothetical protein